MWAERRIRRGTSDDSSFEFQVLCLGLRPTMRRPLFDTPADFLNKIQSENSLLPLAVTSRVQKVNLDLAATAAWFDNTLRSRHRDLLGQAASKRWRPRFQP